MHLPHRVSRCLSRQRGTAFAVFIGEREFGMPEVGLHGAVISLLARGSIRSDVGLRPRLQFVA
jgi:hypothetical protein